MNDDIDINHYQLQKSYSTSKIYHLNLLPIHKATSAIFHDTEIDCVQMNSIECGGMARSSDICLLQAWWPMITAITLTTPAPNSLALAATITDKTSLVAVVKH